MFKRSKEFNNKSRFPAERRTLPADIQAPKCNRTAEVPHRNVLHSAASATLRHFGKTRMSSRKQGFRLPLGDPKHTPLLIVSIDGFNQCKLHSMSENSNRLFQLQQLQCNCCNCNWNSLCHAMHSVHMPCSVTHSEFQLSYRCIVTIQ